MSGGNDRLNPGSDPETMGRVLGKALGFSFVSGVPPATAWRGGRPDAEPPTPEDLEAFREIWDTEEPPAPEEGRPGGNGGGADG
jgi:hypothetical protein